MNELSDAEIAEMVARAMGFPDGGMVFIWAWETLGILSNILADIHTHTAHDQFASTPEIVRWLFFDWPAPLMMAKVKEILVSKEYSPIVKYNFFTETWSASCVYRADLIIKRAHSSAEPRALYEAFLQVMEESNEKS